MTQDVDDTSVEDDFKLSEIGIGQERTQQGGQEGQRGEGMVDEGGSTGNLNFMRENTV